MEHRKTKKLINRLLENDRILNVGMPITDTDIKLVKMELNRSENKHTYKNIIIFVLTLLNVALWMSL